MNEIVHLLSEYVSLAGGELEQPEEGLIRFTPAREDVDRFGTVRLIALNPESMDLHPDAEVAIVGSRFVTDLLDAIRQHGTRWNRGYLDPASHLDLADGVPALPLRRGTVESANVSTRWVPYGRLTAAASIRIGHEVQDQLVVTGFFNLTNGSPLDAEGMGAVSAGLSSTALGSQRGAYDVARSLPLTQTLPAMLSDIENGLSATVADAGQTASRALARELKRLETYYGQLVAEARRRPTNVSQDAVRAYEGDLERRRVEEIARHQVKVDLRPAQLEVVNILAQEVAYSLRDDGHTGRLFGHRRLLGEPAWLVICPNCQATPDHWAVCTGGHVLCSSCSTDCSQCAASSCSAHGGGVCTDSDGRTHVLCADHLLSCPSCQGGYCTDHAAECRVGQHTSCLACSRECEACGSTVCRAHSVQTTTGAFLPSEDLPAERARTLCPACVRFCRGLRDEIRAVDEVDTCKVCGTSVCAEHAGVCTVTGDTQCLSHLTRTDRSRRLVGPHHQARCAAEPDLLFASDEIAPCSECGALFCSEHRVNCYYDGAEFCAEHAVGLRNGEYSCAEHHGTCVVDKAPAKLSSLLTCPVCASPSCLTHSAECSSCGMPVCANDFLVDSKTCRTCGGLRVVDQPDDRLLDAMAELVPDAGPVRRWEVGRDASRHVARATISRWGKTVTFVLNHGSNRATSALQHGVIFGRRLR